MFKCRGPVMSAGLVSVLMAQAAFAQTAPAAAPAPTSAPAAARAPEAAPPPEAVRATETAPAPAPAPPTVPQGYMLVPIPPPGTPGEQVRYDVQYPQRRGALPPGMELPYEEGDPIPPGYRVVKQKRRGLIIAGSIVLGIPWALSVTGAVMNDFDDSTGFLMIPVVGPWIMLGTDGARDRDCDTDTYYDCGDRSGVRGVYVLDGLVQGAGAALLIAGMLSEKKRLVRKDVTVSVVPAGFGEGRYGVFAQGTF